MPVPTDAVAPLDPHRPLSTRTTSAPACAALIAAQVPAGPPPTTSTSADSAAWFSAAAAPATLFRNMVFSLSGVDELGLGRFGHAELVGRHAEPVVLAQGRALVVVAEQAGP